MIEAEIFAETAILLTHPDDARRALAKSRIYAVLFPSASADTHPKDGDVKQAPLVSGAVPKADAQPSPPDHP